MLGLRFPPANSVDREAHAARVVLLAKDCADIDPRWFEAAADDWGKSKAFFPKAHEMRELAAQMQRMAQPRRPMLAAPPPRPKPVPPPLTDAEIATMPGWIVKMGIGMGEIDPARAAQLRGDQAIDSQGISNV